MLKKFHQYLVSAPVNFAHLKIVYFVFWGIATVLTFWFFYFSISTIFMPFPIEYREGAVQVMTQILLAGGNPFSLQYQPLAMNNYGFGYGLVVFPFAKLFGNTLLVHRSINFCFLLACLLLVGKTIWDQKKDILLAFLAGLLIAVTLAGLSGLGAFPSTMGTFLFLLSITIPLRRSFSNSGLIASAMFSLMAFYTKPYFILGFGIVAAYMFIFVSKQRAANYSILFLLAFSLIVLIVRSLFELYFIDTFISNLSNAEFSSAHMRSQLMQLDIEFLPTIILAVILLLLNWAMFSSTAQTQKRFDLEINISKWDAPFLPRPFNYLTFTSVVCFLTFVYVLGPHLGNSMTYGYQILVPPFILCVFQALQVKSRVVVLALGLLLVNILSLEYTLLHPSFLRQRDSAAWHQLYRYVDDLERVVNSPVMASALIECGIPPVDSGQTQFYFRIKPYSDRKLFGPGYETVASNGDAYCSSLENDVRQRKFDGIFITRRARNMIPADLVAEYYVQVDLLTLEMPQTRQTWDIEVWKPSSK